MIPYDQKHELMVTDVGGALVQTDCYNVTTVGGFLLQAAGCDVR